MLPDLHTGFSRGRSGGLVFPSLSEFSTVVSHTVKGFGIVNKAEINVSFFWNSLAFLTISEKAPPSKTMMEWSERWEETPRRVVP